MDFYLNPKQVREVLTEGANEDEVVTVFCIRKGPASKDNGPDAGDVHDLQCVRKPRYEGSSDPQIRKSEDARCGVLTVYAVNRRNPVTGHWGAWRRLNIAQVTKVIYRGVTYAVTQS